jgi:triosephosphate isomerase (TIM)
MARTPILAGNWKMHCTIAEATALASGIARRVGTRTDRMVIVAPPFTALAAVCAAVKGSRIAVSAQNMYWEAKGAFTGEVSPVMLVDLGVTHVILGHSERRQLFGETDAGVRRKLESAFAHGLTPIVCVGETLADREAGSTLKVVGAQVDAAARGLDPALAKRLLFAYEPVWAIGTGRVATPAQAEEIHAAVRKQLGGLGHAADIIPILYGGSVKPENIDGLMAERDIDGALVGGSCLDVDGFARIVEYKQV